MGPRNVAFFRNPASKLLKLPSGPRSELGKRPHRIPPGSQTGFTSAVGELDS